MTSEDGRMASETAERGKRASFDRPIDRDEGR